MTAARPRPRPTRPTPTPLDAAHVHGGAHGVQRVRAVVLRLRRHHGRQHSRRFRRSRPPANGQSVQPGQTVTFTGSATDPEDGTVPGSGLAWTVLLHHNTHVHTAVTASGPSGSVRGRGPRTDRNIQLRDHPHRDRQQRTERHHQRHPSRSGLTPRRPPRRRASPRPPPRPGSVSAWGPSTDNVAVSGYRVERCQGTGCSTYAQIATPTGTSFNDTGLVPVDELQLPGAGGRPVRQREPVLQRGQRHHPVGAGRPARAGGRVHLRRRIRHDRRRHLRQRQHGTITGRHLGHRPLRWRPHLRRRRCARRGAIVDVAESGRPDDPRRLDPALGHAERLAHHHAAAAGLVLPQRQHERRWQCARRRRHGQWQHPHGRRAPARPRPTSGPTWR